MVQGLRDVARDPERVGERELALSSQAAPQRLAFHVGHRVPQQLRPAPPASRGAAVENGEDVGVLEAGADPDLAKETVRTQGGGELGVEQLQGHLAIVPEVVRQPDGRHPAPAQLAHKGVAIA